MLFRLSLKYGLAQSGLVWGLFIPPNSIFKENESDEWARARRLLNHLSTIADGCLVLDISSLNIETHSRYPMQQFPRCTKLLNFVAGTSQQWMFQQHKCVIQFLHSPIGRARKQGFDEHMMQTLEYDTNKHNRYLLPEG